MSKFTMADFCFYRYRWLIVFTFLTILPVKASEFKQKKFGSFEEQLIHEMIYFENLPILEENASYGQVGSVDRSGRKVHQDKYLRVSNGNQAVLADLKGPGCIRRIYFWGHVPGKSFWRQSQTDTHPLLGRSREIEFYIDGSPVPVIRTPLHKFVELFGREAPEKIVGGKAGGYYCYVPIPYKKSLKIVLDIGDLSGFSYQVTYHTYKEVPEKFQSFDAKRLQNALLLTDVRRRLADPDVTPVNGVWLREKRVPRKILQPGECQEITLKDAGVIRELHLFWQRAAAEKQRGLVLECTWDDSSRPAVEVPVDDLFGLDHLAQVDIRHHLIKRKDRVGGAREGWVWISMPYRKNARIALVNRGTKALPVELGLRYERQRKQHPDQGYLHTFWNRTPKKKTVSLHTVANVTSRGKFLATLFSVRKEFPGRQYLDVSPRINIDGKTIPQTTLEEFFNGSGRFREKFVGSFHGVDVLMAGSLSLSRFFVPDQVNFSRSFKLDIPNPGEDMTTVALWYDASPKPSGPGLPEGIELFPGFKKFVEKDAQEAEELRIAKKGPGYSKYVYPDAFPMSGLDDVPWSKGRILWCRRIRNFPFWIDLDLPVNEKGTYDLIAWFLRCPQSGAKVSVSLNGKDYLIEELGKKPQKYFNAYGPNFERIGPVVIGRGIKLSKGFHVLRFSTAQTWKKDPAKNRESWHGFGVDCVRLKKVKETK